MTPKTPYERRDYTALGRLLRAARKRLSETGEKLGVKEVAEKLGLKGPGFVYLVEQGKRKPRDDAFGQWASIYGVSYFDLLKDWHTLPMDLAATLRPKAESGAPDLFAQLTEQEKSELRPFLAFIRWKIAHQATRGKV